MSNQHDDGHDGAGAAAIDGDAAALAGQLAARRAGGTICCAESFTAGLLGQTLASVEDSSEWFDGSIVTYRTAQKRSILQVSSTSVVSEQAAVEMALGAAHLFGADIALSTTGVAGPDSQDGRPPGTVVVGWAVGGATGTRTLELEGDPEQIIVAGVRAALAEALTGLG